jgi:hypothetical protein
MSKKASSAGYPRIATTALTIVLMGYGGPGRADSMVSADGPQTSSWRMAVLFCNPDIPLYRQPGCVAHSTPIGPHHRCNPDIPLYRQPGCIW